MKNLLLILFFIFILSCNDRDTVEFLELSQTSFQLDPLEVEKIINISSDSKWTISDIPDWCVIDKTTGDSQTDIRLSIRPNHTYCKREASIKFSTRSLVRYITIKQDGIEKDKSISWQAFPFNQFKSIEFDPDKHTYNIEARRLFINNSIRDEIYLGNIISSKAQSVANIIEFKGYTYNPINIGSFTGGQFYTQILEYPSLKNMDLLVTDIIKDYPRQNSNFIITSPIIFNSYKHLYFLGYGNIGIDLCKSISGKAYEEKEMSKSIGLIYMYSQILFDVVMDLPEQLIGEHLSDKFIKDNDLSYISSVSYGKTAFLIIESDYDKMIVDSIIKKVLREETLSEYERMIIYNIDIHYLYFTKDSKLNVEHGINMDIIEKYKKSIENNDILPLSFTINDFSSHSVKGIKYHLITP